MTDYMRLQVTDYMRLQVELGAEDVFLRAVKVSTHRSTVTFGVGDREEITIPVARVDAIAALPLVGKKVALHLETWPLPTFAETQAG